MQPMRTVRLEHATDLAGFRHAARTLVLGPLAAGSTAVELALGVARDHAVKASDALEGADGLDPDVCRTLGRLVDGLVHRER